MAISGAGRCEAQLKSEYESSSGSSESVGLERDADVGQDSEVFVPQYRALPNGNMVVTDPKWNEGRGCVFLCSHRGRLIAALRGSEAGDHVGSGGVVVLTTGHFVVVSPLWGTPANSSWGRREYVGAVTWVNQDVGLHDAVSPTNSICGSKADDEVGVGGVTALANGNYVVCSPLWNRDDMPNVGAVTWGDGNIGLMGVVGPSNSLVGGQSSDAVGSGGVLALPNGDYVVSSPDWSNDDNTNVGAVTWVNGMCATVGSLNMKNSLLGNQARKSCRFRCQIAASGTE